MSLFSDVAKTAVPVLGPTIGLANAAIRIGTATATECTGQTRGTLSITAGGITNPSDAISSIITNGMHMMISEFS